MEKINYQRKLDKLIEDLDGEIKSILLHSCCAPCSSYCIEYLSKYFNITVLFYNPNIYPRKEYFHRVEEQIQLIKKMNSNNTLNFIEGDYDVEIFYKHSKNRAHEKEGYEACQNCYRFRMERAAIEAKQLNYDYFATTLSISPHKNSMIINKIGEEISQKIGVKHLPSDFKKKNGFKRSIELSDKLNLYRQDYCGCIFSKKERDKKLDEIQSELSKEKNSKILISACGENCRHKTVSLIKANEIKNLKI